MKCIQGNPDYLRAQVRAALFKEYAYLYRHDKEWLFEHLPALEKKKTPTFVVDWNSRDQEYKAKIRKLHQGLLRLEKPVRITISVIGNRLGILSNLEKHLDKLPLTQKMLSEITESVQQFQIRRCGRIIDRMWEEYGCVVLWKVQRMVGLRSNHFNNITPFLEEYLHSKPQRYVSVRV